MDKFDEIQQEEEMLEELGKLFNEESDIDNKRKVIDMWNIVAKTHAENVKADREFMAKSDEDVEKERDYEIRKEQMSTQRTCALATAGGALLGTVLCLVVKCRLCHNLQMFEVDNTPRSFMAKDVMGLNNIGRI